MSDVELAVPTPKKSGGKRALKIVLISVVSLLAVVAIVVGVACWLLFTPAKLTGIINKYSDKFLTCESHFEKVDLTLFKTFPCVGLDVHNVHLINPVVGAANDTVAAIEEVLVGVNLKAFLHDRSIVVNRLCVNNTSAHLFVDANGNANYNIFATSDTTQEETSGSSLPETITVDHVKIKNLSCTYQDDANGMQGRVEDLDVNVKGSWLQNTADIAADLKIKELALLVYDSLEQETMKLQVNKPALNVDVQGTMDNLNGKVKCTLPKADIQMAGTEFINQELQADKKDLLCIDAPFHANIDSLQFSLQKATVALSRFVLHLNGDVALENKDTLSQVTSPMTVDMSFATDGSWAVEELLPLLPADFTAWAKGMTVNADVALSGTAKGIVGDSVLPLITADVAVSNGAFTDKELLPYSVTHINTNIDAKVDLSAKEAQPSELHIRSLSARAAHSTLSLTGSVHDLMNDFLANIRLQGKVALPDVQPFVPDTLPIDMAGTATLDLNVNTTLSQLSKVDIPHMKLQGAVDIEKLNVRYDSIHAQTPKLALTLKADPGMKKRLPNQLLQITAKSSTLKADLPAMSADAALQNVNIDAVVSNVLDSTIPLALTCDFGFSKIDANMDTISASIANPQGTFTMQPNKKEPAKVSYQVKYSNSALHVKLNDSLSADIAGLSVNGGANYDSLRGNNVLAQWSPNLNVDFKLGYLHAAQLPYVLQIPDIKFNYKPERCEISNASIVFGNSDYYLQGVVIGLEQWLSHEDMLRGELTFTSNYTNVDDLLEVFSGMGVDADTLEQQRKEDKVPAEANPFIVPKDVDFTLHTRIREALAFENELQELAGDIRVKDGVAVLDQVGFVCKAAKMQLTAMYRTPRVNHIFCGLDFHLLDIQISELLDMIPMIDTLVPMLSAFDGHANFHLAAETYLNAFYQPKMSTLRGAANINGDSLVVLDDETFATISKYLLFKKSTRNVIDSLDVEMTVFRKEVELYPFLLTMDKYQVCAAGRHNLDNSYDYHLEILKSPLPTRLALDIQGVMPKLGFKLSKCRYAELYKPEKRNDVQTQTLALKELIRKSLESNVKETTVQYKGLGDTQQ